MNTVEYISNDTFILKRTEPEGYVSCSIEYDTDALQMLSKKFITHEEENQPPDVEYLFKIMKFKKTQITLVDKYFNPDEKICTNVDINNNIKCIIV